MSIGWGNLSVRVYAAQAWVSLTARFAAEHPIIVERLAAILEDPEPAVRLQGARNLQVIFLVAPDRMWALGERLAAVETSAEVLVSYLNHSLRRFSRTDPERCERILAIARSRLAGFAGDAGARDLLQESLGDWTARLFVRQGRPLLGTWLREWAADPEENADLLNAYSSSLRTVYFGRYANHSDDVADAACDRAQEGLEAILTSSIRLSSAARWALRSDVTDEEAQAAGRAYDAAERVIHHAMNQLYFGSGAHADAQDDVLPGLADPGAKARFLLDYSAILGLLRQSREPATLHHLIELYEFLIPGGPAAVFTAIHAIVLGRGAEEGYQFESLASASVVNVVKRYIADHRGVFDDARGRDMLVEILQLFSEVGWPDALRLLYDLPDLLR